MTRYVALKVRTVRRWTATFLDATSHLYKWVLDLVKSAWYPMKGPTRCQEEAYGFFIGPQKRKNLIEGKPAQQYACEVDG